MRRASSSSSAAAAAASSPRRSGHHHHRTLLLLLLACVVVGGAHVVHATRSVQVLPLQQHTATLGADGAKPTTKRLVINAAAAAAAAAGGAAQVQSQPTHITVLAGCASSGFSTPVTIGTGTAPQTFSALVDTGSATLAIAGTSCNNNACSGNQALSPTYTPGASAQDMQSDVSVQYGSGSWTGHAYTDAVNVAGVGSVRMALAAIETATDFFRVSKCSATYNQQNPYQGILGLAYGALSPAGSDAYWDTLMGSNSGGPDDVANVFAHQMCGSSGNGRLWIGGYDSTFFTGALSYTAITDQTWYVVGMSGMTLGGTAVPGVNSASYGTTIVDSGTTALILPSGVYSALTTQIGSNAYFAANFGSDFYASGGYCVVPTSGATTDQLNANLPKLAITLAGGVTLTLNAVPSYLIDQTDGSGTRYYCPGLASADASSSAQTILGYAALSQHTVVYDRANARIGFAPTAQCGTTPTPTVTGYAWYASAWGTCRSSDGTASGCTYTRTVTCKDSNGNAVTDTQCAALTKPSLAETGCQSWASDAGVCRGPDAPSPSAAASWWNAHPTARAIILAVVCIAGVCVAIAFVKFCCKTVCRCCCCRDGAARGRGDGMAEPLTPRRNSALFGRPAQSAGRVAYAAPVVPGGGPMPTRHCVMCNTPAAVPGDRDWSCAACTFRNTAAAPPPQRPAANDVAVVVVH